MRTFNAVIERDPDSGLYVGASPAGRGPQPGGQSRRAGAQPARGRRDAPRRGGPAARVGVRRRSRRSGGVTGRACFTIVDRVDGCDVEPGHWLLEGQRRLPVLLRREACLPLQAMGSRAIPTDSPSGLHHDLLDLPRRWRSPRLVFVNSMSDLFHESVPLSFVRRTSRRW